MITNDEIVMAVHSAGTICILLVCISVVFNIKSVLLKEQVNGFETTNEIELLLTGGRRESDVKAWLIPVLDNCIFFFLFLVFVLIEARIR
jgi:hypothetical protein